MGLWFRSTLRGNGGAGAGSLNVLNVANLTHIKLWKETKMHHEKNHSKIRLV